jgi:hypothetical protein
VAARLGEAATEPLTWSYAMLSSLGAYRKLDPLAKYCVMRHGHAPVRAHNAQEKAIESRVRQEGRREIQRALREEARP